MSIVLLILLFLGVNNTNLLSFLKAQTNDSKMMSRFNNLVNEYTELIKSKQTPTWNYDSHGTDWGDKVNKF
jgi:hypothetical protein